MINIDIIQDVTISIIAAVLGLAFPIIVQTIGQIDTKYGSTRLVERIKRSWEYQFFVFALICAILIRGYYCFAPERAVDWGKINPIIDSSAIILVFVSVVILIIALFLFVFKILRFYNPIKLLNEISGKIERIHKKQQSRQISTPDREVGNLYRQDRAENIEELQYKDLTDLALSVIASKNDDTVLAVYQSLYGCSSIFSKGMAYKQVVFPSFFYRLIRLINKAICSQEKELTSHHNGNAVVQIFIDDYLKTRISQESYSCMWMCLLEQLYKNRTDLIFEYWVWAYQHYELVLSHSLYKGDIEDRGIDGLEHTVTVQDVSNRETDQKEFKLFNCALGGLLLYKECYKLLGDLFYYKSNTFGSRSSLIPNNYAEIINIYLRINQRNYADIVWLERRYPFIDMRGGVSTNDIIKLWIEKYLAILMIRAEYLQTRDGRGHTEFPQIPNTLSEKCGWKEQLQRFVGIIDKILTEVDIHKIAAYLSKESGVGDALRDYIQDLQSSMDRQKVEQEMAPELIEETYTSVKDAMSVFKNRLLSICSMRTGDIPQPYICQLGFTYSKINEKGLYCTDQPFSRNKFSDSYKILVLGQLNANLGHKLLAHTKKSLVILDLDIRRVIDRLQLNDEFIIILNCAHYENSNWFNVLKGGLRAVENSDYKYLYRNITVFCLPNLFLRPSNCMWILRRKELPTVSLGDAPLNPQYTDYMDKIGDGIFANIVDLYRNPEVKDILSHSEEINYDESVLELIDININMYYGDNPQIMRIALMNQWDATPWINWWEVEPFGEYFT